MNRPTSTVAAVVIALVAFGGCAKATGHESAQNVKPVSAHQAAATNSTIQVDLNEFKVSASVTTLTPGKHTLVITNDGKLPHELLVFHPDMAVNAMPQKDGSIDEDAAGANKISDGDNIDPGHSQTRTVDFSSPGTYVLMCNIPGHFMSGMYETVTV
jgi:uncharacterized cupredoxin-like copper-binding protein